MGSSQTLKKNSSKTRNPNSYSDNYIDEVDNLRIQQQWTTLAKIDYSFYLEYVHRGIYEPAAHTDLICEALQDVEAGKLKRLMIFLPPRHSKSMSVSETFPSYFIGKNSERRVIEVSYGDTLAQKFGRANKRKIEEFGKEIFEVELSKDNSSSTNWGIKDHRGGMISAGYGGSITGEGADLLLIDDPIKNRKEADSQTYRDMLWNEWQNTLLTRLHPNAAVIIILTRWHEDDLAGRILKDPEERGKWKIINIPCEAEEDDPLGRKKGEPLWPKRGFDKAWMEDKKKAVGSRTWFALYQQRPSPQEGGIFKRKWWQFYTVLPSHFDEIIQSWDCAFKDTKSSSYVVGQAWGRKGADMYLLDQVRDQMDFPTTIQSFITFTAKWRVARAKLVEDKANGPAVIAMLKKKIPGIIPVEPRGSKEARAQAVSPYMEAGNVYLPDPTTAPWVHDYIEEMAAFPNGATNDQVDATSQALDRLGIKGGSKGYGSKPKGW